MTECEYNPRESAKSILVYYIQRAWEDCGRPWDADNTAEVESIIDAIHRMIEAKMCRCPLE